MFRSRRVLLPCRRALLRAVPLSVVLGRLCAGLLVVVFLCMGVPLQPHLAHSICHVHMCLLWVALAMERRCRHALMLPCRALRRVVLISAVLVRGWFLLPSQPWRRLALCPVPPLSHSPPLLHQPRLVFAPGRCALMRVVGARAVPRAPFLLLMWLGALGEGARVGVGVGAPGGAPLW